MIFSEEIYQPRRWPIPCVGLDSDSVPAREGVLMVLWIRV
jgi:hypothetical protein